MTLFDRTRALSAIGAFALIAAAQPALANEYEDALTALAASDFAAIASDAALIEAIKAQNAANAGLSQGDIDGLDQDWRGQVGASSAPLIENVAGRPASEVLIAARDASEGMLTEIFAMDNRGLNVAMSDTTSDYWQGDEAKFQETFGVGAGAVHIGEVELDESTQSYQSQVSMTISDPADGAVIGAITFGVNVEFLE